MLETDTAQLWWAGKQLDRSKLLRDYVGRNEKTKIVTKLQKKGQGAPGREPVFSAEEQRTMMALAHKKQEEMKVRPNSIKQSVIYIYYMCILELCVCV